MISWWSFLERGVVDAISTVYHLVPTTASPTFWISWWSLECLESKSVHKFGLSPLQPPRSLGAFWGHFERVNEQWKSRQELDGIFCSIFTSLALQAVQLMDYAWNLQFRVDPSLVSYGHAGFSSIIKSCRLVSWSFWYFLVLYCCNTGPTSQIHEPWMFCAHTESY